MSSKSDAAITISTGAPVAQPQRIAPAVDQEPATAPPLEGRLSFPSPVRAYAMSIVVLIHVAAVLAPHYNTVNPADWWISNAYHAFSKGGPPIFTLVSGALLLSVPANQPILLFFQKRLLKVLIPFLFWAVVYLLWRINFLNEPMTLFDVARAFLDGPIYYHLWFIQMILGLYLATPILRYYVQSASPQNLRYFLLVWFLATAVLPTITYFTGLDVNIWVVVTTSYVGYFVLGYYLRDRSLHGSQLLICLFVVVIAMLVTEVGTYLLLINRGGHFDPFFFNNLGIFMVIISVGLFLFLKSVPYDLLFARFPHLGQASNILASTSLGVYFVHVLIMELLASGRLGFQLDWLTFGALIGIPLTWIVTLLLSIAVTRIMQRTEILRWFVP
jgi:surface polysaccharide O-acyltransferase-like enzyme